MSALCLRYITPEKRARIRKVAQENPSLSLMFLAERFGTTEHIVANALHGLPRREQDGFSIWLGKAGRRGAERRKHRRKTEESA